MLGTIAQDVLEAKCSSPTAFVAPMVERPEHVVGIDLRCGQLRPMAQIRVRFALLSLPVFVKFEIFFVSMVLPAEKAAQFFASAAASLAR